MEKQTVARLKREGRADKTVHIHYETWKAAKVQHTIEDRPVSDIMDDALSEYLAKRRAQNGKGRAAG